MHPLIILFTYYRDDEVTRPHWELVQHYNPGVPVVPLVDGMPGFLPGTIDVGQLDWHWGWNRKPWYNIDTFVYRFYQGCPILRAERYIMVESDTLVTMSLAEYYKDVWDADIAGSVIAYPETHPGWVWWEEYVGDLQQTKAGVMPSGVVLYSGKALECLSRSTISCFAELRIGTLARAAGLTLAQVEGGSDTIHCNDHNMIINSDRGVFHPVKHYGGKQGFCLRAHQLGTTLHSRRDRVQ